MPINTKGTPLSWDMNPNDPRTHVCEKCLRNANLILASLGVCPTTMTCRVCKQRLEVGWVHLVRTSVYRAAVAGGRPIVKAETKRRKR